jgi:D-alanyl-D-alanine carboxypeptidase
LILESITKASEDVHTGTLVLVNSSNAYVFPSANTHLINLRDHREKVNGSNTYQVSYDNMLLQKEACAALNRMMVRYFELSEDGSTLVTSAYRTFQDQEDLHSSVKAGYSDHHTGYCISLKKFVTSNISSLESDHWIYENAHKYGFIVRYPDEKADVTGVSDYTHCFRFVGIPHAYYMFENRYCMEEYVDLLKNNYTPEKPLQITADGKPYQVYYLAASASELTTLQVPANYAYTLSGDNVGGFIVTVDLSSPK